MPFGLYGKIKFFINGGRGIGGDQITVDSTLDGEENLGISEAFKVQQREAFSSRYHDGGFRYDRTFFTDEFYSGDEVEIVGAEIWNGIIQVISAQGRVGRQAFNGGPYSLPSLGTSESVIDITRHGDFIFLASNSRIAVYRVDDIAGSASLVQSYIKRELKSIAAPSDANDAMYAASKSGLDVVLERYSVNPATGNVNIAYRSTITVAQLNTALAAGEQSIVNVDQIKAISARGTSIWVYAQRTADIKLVNIVDDRSGVFAAAGTVEVTGGSGAGATVNTFSIDSRTGAITGIAWNNAGTGYSVGDVLTFTQGDRSATYTLVGSDIGGNDSLNEFTGKNIGGGRFTVDAEGDHVLGRLQDVVGATRDSSLEVIASRFVISLFTQAQEERPGNFRGDTLKGSLYDENDPLNVKDPWAGVNPADLAAILTADHVGQPVFLNGRTWYVDAHTESAHDAVVAFAEPTTGDFPAGHRWRASFSGNIASHIPNPRANDIAYDIDLGRLLRYNGVTWVSYTYNRFLGPGPATNESHAKVRVVASTREPKVGLLVAWDGHGLQRVSAFTPATAQSITYDLQPATAEVGGNRIFIYRSSADIPADADARRTGDVVLVATDGATPPTGTTFNGLTGTALATMKRGQIFRYDGTNYVLTLDGRYPWLSINPTQAEITALRVAANIGQPVLLHGWVYSLERVHHAGVNAMATFEDPPSNVFGSIYRFRGSYDFSSDVTSPQNADIIYLKDTGRLERYSGGAWHSWADSLYFGRADTEADAIVRIDNVPDGVDKTTLTVAWRGSDLRKVKTFVESTVDSDTIDLVPTGMTPDDVRNLIKAEVAFITAGSNGALRAPTAADFDRATGHSKVIGWADGRFYKVRPNPTSGHATSATLTEVASGTTISGRRWRGVHWQDNLVGSPQANDVYVNRVNYTWRIYRNNAWENLPASDPWFDTANVFYTAFDTRAEAVAHLTANGEYAIYKIPGSSATPRLYVSSAVVLSTAPAYEWVDAIITEILDQILAASLTPSQLAAIDAVRTRVALPALLTLDERQTRIYEWLNGTDASSMPVPTGIPLRTAGIFGSNYNPETIDSVAVRNKLIVEIVEASGVEAYDGAKVVWDDPDNNEYREYTLTPLNHSTPVQRYVTTETVRYRPGDGDQVLFDLEDVARDTRYDNIVGGTLWIWNEGQEATTVDPSGLPAGASNELQRIHTEIAALTARVEVVVHTTQASYDAAPSNDGKVHMLAIASP